MIRAAFYILLVLGTIHFSSSRSIKDEEYSISVSDGVKFDQMNQSKTLRMSDLRATTVTCEPAYVFLPCTTEVWGQLFLIILYEYLLSLSAHYISEGSELFLEISGTENVFSANIFQMLGMFPQVIVVLVSGFSGTADTVETMAEMGMGILAGSVIMNLTLVWGSVIAFGNYDLSKNQDLQTQSQQKFKLTGYGVRTDIQTKYTARIMLLSMIPFLLLQLAKILSSSSAKKVVIVISLIITVLYLVGYMTYQAFTPWIKERRLEFLMSKYIEKNLLQSLRMSNGQPNQAAISELFSKIDQNNDKEITAAELRSLIIGMQIEVFGLKADDFVSKLMEDLDKSADSTITQDEFNDGISKFLSEANSSKNNQARRAKKKSPSVRNSEGNSEEQQSLLATGEGTKMTSDINVWWSYIKGAIFIVCGTAVTFVLATPLMTSIQDFAADINIPSFLISYLVVPLALGFKMAYRAITSARQKTEEAASLTLSELYGGVFMNNVMGLVIFLSLVCIKDLSWDVSAEVLAVLIICSGVGLSATFSSTFPLWTCIIAYALYPLSLAFIYVLTTLLGWG